MINELISILRSVKPYELLHEEAHHLGLPFMSSYQIAIRFAQEFPDHEMVRRYPIGGLGTNEKTSLAQQIGKTLSQAIKNENRQIEGGFISHENVNAMTFDGGDQRGEVTPSTLEKRGGHSIFRCTR